MTMYAVKIGEIDVISDSPITEEERQTAIAYAEKNILEIQCIGGLRLRFVLNRETVRLTRR